MTTYEDAIDEMFSIIRLAFNSNAGAIVGYIPDIRWPGIKEEGTPDASKFWARVSQQTVIEEQTTLRGNAGEKRYTASGLIFVQLFCPFSDVAGYPKGRKLAKMARNAFREAPSSGKVWFRNARINELASEDGAYRFNVVTEYEYDEIG